MENEETNTSQQFKRSQSDPTGGASSEQKREEIRKVRATKDFYEILGVSKTATKEEITKAYRKLALKFHPDKNKEPGADEAFKKIAQAYDCLSTDEKRGKYDQFGSEEPEQHYRHYRQYYNDDISPDDIFRMFFGNAFFEGENMPRQRFVFRTYNMGGMGGFPGRPQRARGEHRDQANEGRNKYLPLLQCLPILIIIIASFGLNFSFSSDEPLYSLSQNYKFPIQRQTANLRLQYYVDKSFDSKVGPQKAKLRQLEETIEKEYITKLQNRCNYMTEKKRSFEKMAEFSQEQDRETYRRRAAELDTAACDTVNSYKVNYPQLFK